MKYPYGIGHIYSGKVVLYNPKLMKAPEGFADTLDPKHGDKLGIIDIQYQYTMLAAALASGGSMSNFEPGKERLIACKKAGARIYPSNEAFAQALKTEEIACGIMWKARAVQWQNAGINVETVAPKEGVPMYVSGFVMPKNAPNKDGAYAYLDAMMAAVGAGELRRRHGLQPDRHQRQGAGRPAEAHRLHRRGEEAPGRPRLRLHGQERRRRSRTGGTSRSRADVTDAALAHGPVVEKRRGEGLTAAALIGPATIFVAALPAGAARHPVPLQPERVRRRPRR